MNEMKLKELLARELPPVPESFHLAVAGTLERIVAEEAAGMATRNFSEDQTGRPSVRRTLLLAALILCLLATAAVAAIRWQIFDGMWPFAGAPDGAEQVMHSHLAQETVNGVEITVEEAGYDGRSLLLVYSYRIPDAELASGAHQDGQRNFAYQESCMQLLRDRGVGWWIDHIWFDGRAMDMPGNSYGQTVIDVENGMLTEKQVYRLDHEGVTLNGPVEVSLPIGERQPLEAYSRKEHPEKYAEDGTLLLPDAGMITFTLEAGHRSQVTVSTPDSPLVLDELTAKVTEAAFSPIMTYVTLSLEADPDALAAYKAENGEGIYDEDGRLIYAYDGTDLMAGWIYSLQLVDAQGRVLTTEGGCNGFGVDWAEFVYPAQAELPDELWLAPVNAGQADLTRAVRVR